MPHQLEGVLKDTIRQVSVIVIFLPLSTLLNIQRLAWVLNMCYLMHEQQRKFKAFGSMELR